MRTTLVYGGGDVNKKGVAQKGVEDKSTAVQTAYVEQTLTPKWNETLFWDVYGKFPTGILLRVFDFDAATGDDLMGALTIPFSVGAMNGEPKWHQLGALAIVLLLCVCMC